MDSGATLVEARDLLRHSDVKQTDTYLRSKSKRLRDVITRKEALEREQERSRQSEREKDCHTETECDNPLPPVSNASESAEVVKH